MVHREELIEDAAKAMVALAPGESWEDCDQEWYLRDAAIARAVFEKAQREPSDASVRAALRVWFRGAIAGGWTAEHEARMRAALRAAWEVTDG